MANLTSRRNRRGNRGVSVDLEWFIESLSRATSMEVRIPRNKAGGVGGGSLCEPTSHSSGRFSVELLFSELLSKFDDGMSSKEKVDAALEKFHGAELTCQWTNIRLQHDKSRHNSGVTVWSVIEQARRKIAALLGDFCWDEASSGFGFGPGATFLLSRSQADASYKYSGKPESTIGNATASVAALAAAPLWKKGLEYSEKSTLDGLDLLEIVAGNRVVTVPKNYKTQRSIAVEPRMNIYVQKGIGKMIRKRLKRVKIDLNDQSVNQSLARIATVAGLATVDLSMASDTLAYELVRKLLPTDWFAALEQSRSPVGVLPSGERIVYRKFSSMGNGYTFELESLIFWALSAAVCEIHTGDGTLVWVYGDDIIVPAQIIPQLFDVLEFCGFEPNPKKSHWEGDYRESCGKHYFQGDDVTPFYIRRPVKRLQDLFLLHNNLRRWCDRNWWNDEWDRFEMKRLLAALRALAPSSWRKPRIPDGYGDGAFIGTFDEAVPRRHPAGWDCYLATVLVEDGLLSETSGYGRLCKTLVHLESESRHVERYFANWQLNVFPNGEIDYVDPKYLHLAHCYKSAAEPYVGDAVKASRTVVKKITTGQFTLLDF